MKDFRFTAKNRNAYEQFHFDDPVFIIGWVGIILTLVLIFTVFFHIVFMNFSLPKWLLIILMAMIAGGVIILSVIFIHTMKTKKEMLSVLKKLDEGITYGAFDGITYKNDPFDMFNSVIPITKRLVEERYVTSILDRQIEIQHLQNQINPHFIYNTLEGIRAKALIENQEDIASMTEALGSFLRYNIGKLNEMVSLGQEIRNMERYAQIQEYRFGGRIKMQFEIDNTELLRKLLIPKLTLQPIVENSVFHGLEPKSGMGVIRITAMLTDCNVRICVSDNGIGMTEEMLDYLNDRMLHKPAKPLPESNHSGSGIALENVNERIRLFFGPSYGVTIQSTLGVGTDVYIKLPLPAEFYEE